MTYSIIKLSTFICRCDLIQSYITPVPAHCHFNKTHTHLNESVINQVMFTQFKHKVAITYLVIYNSNWLHITDLALGYKFSLCCWCSLYESCCSCSNWLGCFQYLFFKVQILIHLLETQKTLVLLEIKNTSVFNTTIVHLTWLQFCLCACVCVCVCLCS